MRVAYQRPGMESWPVSPGPPEGWRVFCVADDAELEALLHAEPVDVVLAFLPEDASAFARTLSRLRAAAPGVPLVAAAPAVREEDAVAALASGAADYWLESMSGARLRVSLEQAWRFQCNQEHLRHSQKLEAIGRLSSGIAHDFNNILTAIVGCANILLEDLPPGHASREDVEEIRRAGGRATELTRQLLAFSRRGGGGIVRAVDLRLVCGDMRKMLQRLLPADIELEMLLPSVLPSVMVDLGQVEQVLLNLVINAGDAMSKGGRITVQLATEPSGAPGLSGPCVRMSVSDTGVGMDEPTRARIFDPFYTTKTEGTGIGLATVWDIVSRSGGVVIVESVPGRGSSFHVYWPRCEQAAEPPVVKTRAGALRPSRRARVLVVEDDAVVRRFTERCLERAGYEVFGAADGSEALRLCQSQEGLFDVVVLDIVLPVVRGTEVALRMRSHQPSARVLYISGYRQDESFPAVTGAAFLQKPFTAETLTERVHALLAGSSA